MKTYHTFSSTETQRIGQVLAKKVLSTRGKLRGAIVIGLRGELGAGKTTLVQGFFRGAGAKRKATSPTFVLVRRMPIRKKFFRNIFHIDMYRLRGRRDFPALGIEKEMADPKNVILVEWADKAQRILPAETLWVTLKHGRIGNERIVQVWR